ncbi:MAG TPA: class I SAM-dependent methyltransferase [Solirubrobacteraceae bacterium]|nr:class I SAM-dependent methyltransferase [Solirubrobacteraceae bacterium]
MSARSRLEALRARANAFGPRYAVAHAAHRAALRIGHRAEDAMLEIEGERGVLGPAHLGWSDNSSEANRRRWDEWDWSALGEEWTESEEWKQGLVDDVLLRVMPAGGTVVEIGPGAGRWSVFLAARCDRLIVVDVARAPLDAVVDRLAGADNLECLLSDGASLTGVGDAAADAVWSFDVFVYVAPADQAAYLAEIARVLRPDGVAAVHHADGRNRGRAPSRLGWRAPMTATLFAALARDRGLEVTDQIRHWSGGRYGLDPYHDVITVLRREV